MSIDSIEQEEAGSEAGLTIEGEEALKNLIDIPYITLNRFCGEYQAEVMMEGTDAECAARLDWILAEAAS